MQERLQSKQDFHVRARGDWIVQSECKAIWMTQNPYLHSVFEWPGLVTSFSLHCWEKCQAGHEQMLISVLLRTFTPVDDNLCEEILAMVKACSGWTLDVSQHHKHHLSQSSSSTDKHLAFKGFFIFQKTLHFYSPEFKLAKSHQDTQSQ